MCSKQCIYYLQSLMFYVQTSKFQKLYTFQERWTLFTKFHDFYILASRRWNNRQTAKEILVKMKVDDEHEVPNIIELLLSFVNVGLFSLHVLYWTQNGNNFTTYKVFEKKYIDYTCIYHIAIIFMEIGKINSRTNHSIKLVMLHCDIIVHCYNFLSKDVNKCNLK